MTPIQSWIWVSGYIVVPVVLSRIFSKLSYLWFGCSAYRGRKVTLAEIFELWGFIIGLSAMIWLAI